MIILLPAGRHETEFIILYDIRRFIGLCVVDLGPLYKRCRS